MLAGLGPIATAQDPFVLEDAVAVIPLDRQVLAVVTGRGQVAVELDSSEQLLWSGSRGRVGLAVTNRRVLGVSAIGSGWREVRQRLAEQDLADPVLGHRVALVSTPQRLLAYDADRNAWVSESLGTNERLIGVRAGSASGLFVTDRRALALRAGQARLDVAKLRVKEEVEAIGAVAAAATVTTSQRVLIHDGIWSERKRALH